MNAALDAPEPPTCDVLAWGGLGNDGVIDLAVGTKGELFLTGHFEKAADIAGAGVSSAGHSDIFVAQLEDSGRARWVQRLGGPGVDQPSALALTQEGDVVVVGRAADACVAARLGAREGHEQWQTRLPGPSHCRAVAISSEGDIWVTGYFGGSLALAGRAHASRGSNDIFLARLAVSSGAVELLKTFGGVGNELPRALEALPGGGLVLAGQFSGEVPPSRGAVDFGTGPVESAGDFDAFLLVLSPEGKTRWVKTLGDVGFDLVKSVHVLSDGSIIASGALQRAQDFGSEPPFFAGGWDGFVARYGANGSSRWVRRFSGETTQGHSVTADTLGRLWVAGHYEKELRVGDLRLVAKESPREAFVATLSAAGEVLRAETWSGEGDRYVYAVAASEQDAWVAGHFSGSLRACGHSATSAGGDDGFVIRVPLVRGRESL